MKVNYFSIPEITVSYKDNVKASERFVVKCSEDASQGSDVRNQRKT